MATANHLRDQHTPATLGVTRESTPTRPGVTPEGIPTRPDGIAATATARNQTHPPTPLGVTSELAGQRARTVRRYGQQVRAALEQNRQEVSEHAAGGGGTAAHLAERTTRGHIWLLPQDSPLRRPWRANMVARPSTSTTEVPSGPLKLSQPLNDAQLAALRRTCVLLSGIPQEDCAICFSPMKLDQKDSVIRLPCGGAHVFHFKCIEPWLRRARLCPTCRQTLKVAPDRRPRTIERRLTPPPPATAASGSARRPWRG